MDAAPLALCFGDRRGGLLAALQSLPANLARVTVSPTNEHPLKEASNAIAIE
jgi:hypothetical protein